MKITYLIGAGASYPALPLAVDSNDEEKDGLASRMLILADTILKDPPRDLTLDKLDLEQISEEWTWLAIESRKFGNVDTLGKFLYIKGHDDFKRLKQALSSYFVFEQLFFKRVDTRYLVFLSTVMRSARNFPENIKIFTWNYDFQFQLAARNFVLERVDQGGQDLYTHNPLISYYPPLGNLDLRLIGEANHSLINLNGIAGLYTFDRKITDSLLFCSPSEYEDTVRKNASNWGGNSDWYLNFAWEEEGDKNNYAILKSAEETEILIVIGYSFPFFNREVDNYLMEKILERGNCKKIVYQNPTLSGEFLREYYNLPQDFPIHHEKRVTEFYIPREFNY